MSGDYTVTISAEYFAELFETANAEERLAKEFAAIVSERDELKKKLNCKCDECVSYEEAKVLKASLAAARKCIDEVAAAVAAEQGIDEIERIIRAYREAKETEP